jgi:hypothetical protein
VGADDVVRFLCLDEGGEHLAHGGGELLEADGVLHHGGGFFAGDGLVVRKEESSLAEVALGFFVIAAVDGVVRALEKAVFAVFDELERGVFHIRMQALDRVVRDDHGGADVVLGLDLFRRSEVLADAESAPSAVLAEADAEVLGDEPGAAVDELAAGLTVDEVHAEALFPVVLFPAWFVETLDDEDEVAHGGLDGAEPSVVCLGVGGVRREEADDGAERAFLIEQRAAWLAGVDGIPVAIGKIPVDDFTGSLEVFFQIRDEYGGGDHGV